MSLLVLCAWARPYPSVGLSNADTIETVDSADGQVRVHYSIAGPNQTRLDDVDGSGAPDFPETVAETAALALQTYASLGFRAFPREADQGLTLGGSGAVDIYLPDLGAASDGSFEIDACDGSQCVGYLRVDNDLAPYGANWPLGVEILVTHELFHGIQYAYGVDYAGWVSEGGATWAVRQFDETSPDFVYFADFYLEQAERPVDRPPGGLNTFQYGTALFWDFLTTRHDVALMNEALEALGPVSSADPDVEVLPILDELLQARGDDLGSAFREFTRYNLALGARAGSRESYPYAALLTPPPATLAGSEIDDSVRVFPFGMRFLRYQHGGGLTHFGVSGEGSETVEASIHPTDGTAVLPAIWEGVSGTELELDAGTYWITLTSVTPGSSVEVDVCVGVAGELDCVPSEPAAPGPVEETEGCGCQTGAGAMGFWVAALAVVLGRRRC